VPKNFRKAGVTMKNNATLQSIESINPTTKGDKFSPNLYNWMKRQNKRFAGKLLAYEEKVEAGLGSIWIGFYEGTDFFGSRLLGILCGGTEEILVCWQGLNKMTEIKDFWKNYLAYGRCAIDKNHKMDFIGDEKRWKINGKTRTCLWCKNCTQKLKKWKETKVIEHEDWENIAT
jgi:hypothetical protein